MYALRFNSKLVRLEAVPSPFGHFHPMPRFNSKLVRLESGALSCFNSKLVRLEDTGFILDAPLRLCFNSKLVRLEARLVFQVISGCFNSKLVRLEGEGYPGLQGFNSKLVRLEAPRYHYLCITGQAYCMLFQFQTGAIRRSTRKYDGSEFQFQTGAIRR